MLNKYISLVCVVFSKNKSYILLCLSLFNGRNILHPLFVDILNDALNTLLWVIVSSFRTLKPSIAPIIPRYVRGGNDSTVKQLDLMASFLIRISSNIIIIMFDVSVYVNDLNWY